MGTHGTAAPIGKPAAAGIALALVSMPVHLLLTHGQSVQLAAVVLAAVGAIYAGFVLQSGSLRQNLVELTVATGFLLAALAGIWASQWWIPAGYLAHGIWDWLHHGNRGRFVVIPLWYPPFCAAVDWVLAAGLVILWVQ